MPLNLRLDSFSLTNTLNNLPKLILLDILIIRVFNTNIYKVYLGSLLSSSSSLTRSSNSRELRLKLNR